MKRSLWLRRVKQEKRILSKIVVKFCLTRFAAAICHSEPVDRTAWESERSFGDCHTSDTVTGSQWQEKRILSNFVGLFCCVHARAGRQTNRHIESHILVVFTGNFTGQPMPKRAYFVTLDYTTFLTFFQEKFIHKPGGKILDFSRFFQCTMHSSQCTMDVSTYYKFLYHRGAIPQLCIMHFALCINSII